MVNADRIASPNRSRAPPRVNAARPFGLRPQTANAAPDVGNPNGASSGTASAFSRENGPPSPNSGGSSASVNPFGRMLRRYSQGAGKNNAAGQEAASLAAAAVTNTRNNAAVRSTSPYRQVPEHSAHRSSALRASSAAPVRSLSQPAFGAGPAASDAARATSPLSDTLAALVDSPLAQTSHQPAAAHASDAPASALVSSEGAPDAAAAPVSTAAGPSSNATPEAGVHRIRLVPHLEATRSLHFEPIERDVRESSTPVKIGRFTDRANPNGIGAQDMQAIATVAGVGGGAPGAADTASTVVAPASGAQTSTIAGVQAHAAPHARGGAIPSSAGGGGRVDSGRIAFKSKVVSRGHAEIWCEAGGKFFIRDTKSSSGTFLNHIRLAAPNVESRPFAIKDGDVVQLGVDYQGGTEEIYRCVKMRVELNRGWQRGANQFNVNALRQLRALQGSPLPAPAADSKDKTVAGGLMTNRQSMSVTDCCICLFSVTVCQALFIAPCSHVFHYKCIRPLLVLHHPGFSCPLCRTFADLEADVEQDEAWQEALVKGVTGGSPEVATPMVEEMRPLGIQQAQDQARDIEGASVQADATAVQNADAATQISGGGSAQSGSTRPFASPRPLSSRNQTDWSRPDTAVSPQAPSSSPHLHQTQEDEEEEMIADYPEAYVAGDRDAGLAALNAGAGAALGSGSGFSPVPAASGEGFDRRGSNPIDMPQPHPHARAHLVGSSPGTNTPPGPASPGSGLSMGTGLDDARTPLNNTFLSTLAEAPLPVMTGAIRSHRLPSGASGSIAELSSAGDLDFGRSAVQMPSFAGAVHAGEGQENGNLGVDGHSRDGSGSNESVTPRAPSGTGKGKTPASPSLDASEGGSSNPGATHTSSSNANANATLNPGAYGSYVSRATNRDSTGSGSGSSSNPSSSHHTENGGPGTGTGTGLTPSKLSKFRKRFA